MIFFCEGVILLDGWLWIVMIVLVFFFIVILKILCGCIIELFNVFLKI